MKTNKPSLQINVGGVKLRNPVLLASGTCGYGTELLGQVRYQALGGLVAKSVTLHPREGNAMPRVVECASGMLNAIGLANVGVEAFCKDKLPAIKKLPCKVIANVAGSTQAEYIEVVSRLADQKLLAGIELNVSCPNVRAGGIEFGRDPKVLSQLVKVIRKKTQLPLWIKLSPNVTDIRTLAKAAEENGADALTIMNTLIGMRVDIHKRRPILANTIGGLSGPAIKPVAIHLVYKVSQAVSIPIVGVGGIETTEDALEFIMAGASAIQIGTGTFRDPKIAETIVSGITAYLKKQRIPSLKKIIGVV
jgi:dihydroorotate dehydrogenase (NAD+) catalytic subunit